DGSTDSTAEISSLADVEIIKHPKNLGKGVSLKTAFNWAIKNKLDILVTLDGDGQHNPNEIPTLIKPIVMGNADAVNGSRFMEIDNNAPGYRKLGQNLLTTATNIGSKSNTSDSQNGFRAFSKKTFDSFRFKTSGMGIESEMLIDLAKKGFTIVEIPISCKYNVNIPSKKNPFSHGISVLLTIVKFVGADRPLTFFGIPGLIVLIIGVYFGINVVNIFYATSEIALGTALLMLLLIISGIFAIFAGLILYVISSTIKSLSG
ncbi:MAG: glycosyltransferase family 2 protein, partial [SAR202 cluster bacterium]|nr:glycosyltransferase family 2 protein [SAR202 cluster bacterium]